MPDKSVAILTPIGVNSNVHNLHMMRMMNAMKPPKNCILHKIGHFIDHGRNSLARQAIEDGYDYVFFVDSDIAINTFTIVRMLCRAVDEGIPVQSGIYMQKRPWYKFHIYKFWNGELLPLARDIHEVKKYLHESSEIDAAGAGCLFISTKFLQSLEQPWFRTTIDKNNEVVGEDIYFFQKLIEKRIKTILDGEIVMHCKGQDIYPNDFTDGFLELGDKVKEYNTRQRHLFMERLKVMKGL